MALFGGARDISLFRHLNRELLGDIITQQCVYYKLNLEESSAMSPNIPANSLDLSLASLKFLALTDFWNRVLIFQI